MSVVVFRSLTTVHFYVQSVSFSKMHEKSQNPALESQRLDGNNAWMARMETPTLSLVKRKPEFSLQFNFDRELFF